MIIITIFFWTIITLFISYIGLGLAIIFGGFVSRVMDDENPLDWKDILLAAILWPAVIFMRWRLYE